MCSWKALSAWNFASEFDFIEAILSVSHENTGILLIYENFMTKSSEHEKKNLFSKWLSIHVLKKSNFKVEKCKI